MDARWLTTTSKRSQLFIWSSGLGVEPWSRSKLSLGKRSRSTLNPLTRLTGSRSVLKRKKAFLPCSKGTMLIFIFCYICNCYYLFFGMLILLETSYAFLTSDADEAILVAFAGSSMLVSSLLMTRPQRTTTSRVDLSSILSLLWGVVTSLNLMN